MIRIRENQEVNAGRDDHVNYKSCGLDAFKIHKAAGVEVASKTGWSRWEDMGASKYDPQKRHVYRCEYTIKGFHKKVVLIKTVAGIFTGRERYLDDSREEKIFSASFSDEEMDENKAKKRWEGILNKVYKELGTHKLYYYDDKSKCKGEVTLKATSRREAEIFIEDAFKKLYGSDAYLTIQSY